MFIRIFLFVMMNILFMASIGIIFNVILPMFGTHVPQDGLLYAFILGLLGSFISLAFTRFSAKRLYNVNLLDESHQIYRMVKELTEKANIPMPEVGIYFSDAPNAFATGPTKSHALVAVSSGLLKELNKEEVQAVLAHEVAHIKNGDMVKMAIIQSVVNAFVIYLSRIIASRFDSFRTLIYLFSQIVLGFLALPLQLWFSRKREFKADYGAAELTSSQHMINALKRLGEVNKVETGELQALAINGKPSFSKLFSTHPTIEERIEALYQFSPKTFK